MALILAPFGVAQSEAPGARQGLLKALGIAESVTMGARREGWPFLIDIRDWASSSELVLFQARGRSDYLFLTFQGTNGLWTSEPVLRALDPGLAFGQAIRLSLGEFLALGRKAIAELPGWTSGTDLLRIRIEPAGTSDELGPVSVEFFGLADPSWPGPPASVAWDSFLVPWRGAWFEPSEELHLQPAGFAWSRPGEGGGISLRSWDLRLGDELRWEVVSGTVENVLLEWISSDGAKALTFYRGKEPALPLLSPEGKGFWRLLVNRDAHRGFLPQAGAVRVDLYRPVLKPPFVPLPSVKGASSGSTE